MTESQEQQALFQWANLSIQKYPELKLLFHVPNGGLRNLRTAYILKKEGVKAGVPDLFLPAPKGNYHGLFIEMKTDVGKTSKEQKLWLSNLEEQGYKALVCRGWIKAREVIEEYLNLK